MFELEKIIKTESAKHDSFYLYDESSILRQLNTLKSNFPETEFLYSIKCNPNSNILNCILSATHDRRQLSTKRFYLNHRLFYRA